MINLIQNNISKCLMDFLESYMKDKGWALSNRNLVGLDGFILGLLKFTKDEFTLSFIASRQGLDIILNLVVEGNEYKIEGIHNLKCFTRNMLIKTLDLMLDKIKGGDILWIS